MSAFADEAFMLQFDERSEILADEAFDAIREAYDMLGLKVPDPMVMKHQDFRALMKGAFKAGATFGLEVSIAAMKDDIRESDIARARRRPAPDRPG